MYFSLNYKPPWTGCTLWTKLLMENNRRDFPYGNGVKKNILKGIEHSVNELQEQPEVTHFYHLMFIYHI